MHPRPCFLQQGHLLFVSQIWQSQFAFMTPGKWIPKTGHAA